MILSASRRTDIPAFYSDWFFERIIDKEIYVRNPINKNQVSILKINPEVVDCIVFWTKNPKDMILKLNKLKDYNYYFQFTINSYSKDIEENLPQKIFLIDEFKKLSDLIGSDRIIWRYDPIILTPRYTVDYHIEYFQKIAYKLKGYTKKSVISFLDHYKKIEKNLFKINSVEISDINKKKIGKYFSEIGKSLNIDIETCAENFSLDEYGINNSSCIDRKLIEKIIGYELKIKKDLNQRKECGCIESIDIGAYNSCMNGCLYCYANNSKNSIDLNIRKYNKNSKLIIGDIESKDKIYVKKLESNKVTQKTLFDKL